MTERAILVGNLKWFGVRLLVLGVVAWVASVHWPIVPVLYADFTRTKPSPAAVRYVHRYNVKSPVLRALARDNIRAGQPPDEVLARYGPFEVVDAGRFVELSDRPADGLAFEGYGIIARDGRLVGAYWYTCTADVEFFNTLSKPEWAECNAALHERKKQIGADRRDARRALLGPLAVDGEQHRWDERVANQRAAGMADAGPLIYLAIYEPPSEPQP